MLNNLSKNNWRRRWSSHLLSALLLLGCNSQILAQDNTSQSDKKIVLELNKLASLDSACELTFLTRNQMKTPIEKLALEFAFLDQNGQLSKLATLNFGALVPNRPKITQFGLPDLSCENISQLFINSAPECIGVSGEDCIARISISNKTKVEF